METKELIAPRFKVIADYPNSKNLIGTILEMPNFDKEFTKDAWCKSKETYPHLFKKLNWWEYRKTEDMPAYLKHRNDITTENWTYEKIIGWDMKNLQGLINPKERTCCSLLMWNPKYGYFPAEKEDYENYIDNLQLAYNDINKKRCYAFLFDVVLSLNSN